MPGRSDLAEAVARNLFKLMAIKDEYEVARLWTDGSFLRQLGQRVRALGRARGPPRPAAPGRARRHHRPPEEAPLRPLDAARHAPARPPEAPARHRPRPVRPHRRAPDGAPAAAPTTRRCSTSWSERLDADNHATAVELARVPGADPRLRPRQGGERPARQGSRSRAAGALARWRRPTAAGRRIALSRARTPASGAGPARRDRRARGRPGRRGALGSPGSCRAGPTACAGRRGRRRRRSRSA